MNAITTYHVPARSTEKAVCFTGLFVIGQIERRLDVWAPKSLCVEKDGKWAMQAWFAQKKVTEIENERVSHTDRTYWIGSFCCLEG
jgi:hypothetical protein